MNRVSGALCALVVAASVPHAASAASQLAVGGFHACRVTAQSGLECWGNNGSGALGDGTIELRATAAPVLALPFGVRSVDAGRTHTCALGESGQLLCWGENGEGQYGSGNNTASFFPATIPGAGSDLAGIATGAQHTCVLSAAGQVRCAGNNVQGQLGDGTQSSRPSYLAVAGLPVIADVVAGYDHTCARTAAGAAYCWGVNDLGQLGNGLQPGLSPTVVSGLSGAKALAAGWYHTCALTSSDGVMCWGSNMTGQLGDGSVVQLRSMPQAGTTVLDGLVRSVVAGGDHTCALTSAGAVWCWGLNQFGQLGDGTTDTRDTPVAVVGLGSGVASIDAGERHTCATLDSGITKCWGDNVLSQLGDGTSTMRLVPSTVAAPAVEGPARLAVLRGPPEADAGDLAGTSVAIGDDAAGENVFVGAPGTAGGGAVHVHVRPSSGVAGRGSAKLAFAGSLSKDSAPAGVLTPPPGGGIGDKFGQAVASSPDGATIVVGAPDRGGGGAVFVYRRPAGGWDSEPPAPPIEIAAPAPSGGVVPQDFGQTLAFAADGTLVVGAPAANVGANAAAGAAYAFRDNGASLAPIGAALTASSPQANAQFGAAVAVDDGMIGVGAPNENDGTATQRGAAYLFAAGPASVGAASRVTHGGGQIGDKFGASVGVDNGVLVVGAPGDDTTAGTDSGSVRTFTIGDTGIAIERGILMPAPGAEQAAGTAVAVRDGTVLIGAPLASSFGEPRAGRAYLYLLDEQLAAEQDADATIGNLSGDAGDEFARAVAIGRHTLGVGVPNDAEPDGGGVPQDEIGRTDTFLLERILRDGFE